MELYFFLLIIPLCYCNWESEWMVPIQETYSREATRAGSEAESIKMSDNNPSLSVGSPLLVKATNNDIHLQSFKNKDIIYGAISGESMSSSLTQKLRSALHSAKILAGTLKTQIASIASREKLLKEIIITGRSGVTVLTVLLLGKLPRTYIIRDGFWTLCNGIVQYPINARRSNNFLNDLFAAPRCIGQEVTSRRDPCVFNSLIKYETIPRHREIVYNEDDYLCLKPNFNETLEQYLSVPKYIVNETCRDGTVRKLADNSLQCGLRVMSEYVYYPHKSSITNSLPVEYCSEIDGACKLIIAWHISNTSIENFEFMKNDEAFKKFFMSANVRSA